MNIYCAACILILSSAMQTDKEAIYSGLKAHHENLQNIVAKYDLEWIPTPPKSALEMDGKEIMGGKVYTCHDPVMTHEEIWYLDGRMRHESRLSVESREYLPRINSNTIPHSEIINVYTNQKYEYLWKQ